MTDAKQKHHELKINPEYFECVLFGTKTFEIRFNDRNYEVGDTVTLNEFEPHTGYTGRKESFYITYTTQYAQKEGWVVFSIVRKNDRR